jgi:hypothetical protein
MTEGYTAKFWLRALELANKGVKVCEECSTVNGEDITRSLHPKRKVYAVVRVAFRKPDMIHASNLGLFCTRCRRGKYELKEKDTKTLPMFGESDAKV